MRNFSRLILALSLVYPFCAYSAATSYDTERKAIEENVKEADPTMQEINPELVPKSASPGESVEGRTENTTPQQNKQIYREYKDLMKQSNTPDASNVDYSD